MKQNQLYLLSEQYYADFPDPKLMRNKEYVDGQPHNRPCFLAFKGKTNIEISWLVPISSKIDKFKKEEHKKIEKYGRCNTIRFGTVLNRDAAFFP